jgi:F420-non-reducing hydrogenase small subunit
MPDGHIDLCLFSGGIRSTENEDLAHLLRAKSKVLVAFGSCANEGCIPGLANLSSIAQVIDTAFEGPSTDNPEHRRPIPEWEAPEGVLHLPALLPHLRTLDQVVPIDYIVPGGPPESKRVTEVVTLAAAAFAGTAELPPRGTVLGGGISTVCDECGRIRNVKKIAAFARIQELWSVDPELCLLEQGIPCNGPATRDGCGALCPTAGAQCIGCYGPADGVVDVGARLMSAFASVLDADDEASIERLLDGIPDPVGQVYRFGLAKSLLRAARSSPAVPEVPDPMPSAASPASGSHAPTGAGTTAAREPAVAGAHRGPER